MIMPSEAKEGKALKLKKIQKENNLYKVFFEDNSSFLCNENDIFEYKLYKDALINNEIIDELRKRNSYYECLNEGIKIVNTKFYSSKQVETRLIKKKYDLDSINEVIAYLTSVNAINDDEFYKSYVRFKANQGYGPVYIKNKLYELGINREVNFSTETQYKLIKKHLLSKNNLKNNKNVFIKKFKNKMILQGFDLSIIEMVINDNEILGNDEIIKNDFIKLHTKYQNKYDEYQLKQFIRKKLLSKGYLQSEIDSIMKEGF
ncbi:regulatory protein [Bacilli bacterium PM5-3]|nr:regulatory protein [Bacilli bacterium PM5-3]MDH6603430.1 regulatory protein [Bacilli bacterium PM5-9]